MPSLTLQPVQTEDAPVPSRHEGCRARASERPADPVERLHDVDLLALVVGGNVALLAEAILLGGALKGVLRGHGLTKRQTRRLEAAVELGRRALLARGHRARLTTPAQVYGFLVPRLAGHATERFHIIGLDPRSNVLGDACVATGGVDSTTVDPREVFRLAIGWRASALVLGHNHPSGDPTESPSDVALTRQLVEAGKLLSIRILDHIIVGAGSYASLAERGLMTSR